MERKAIVTLHPYAPFINEILDHEFVEGIRLNTVMPIKHTREEILKRLNDAAQKRGKQFWIDLKCRQLRTIDYSVPPFTELKLSHDIEVYTPCKIYFSDRRESATVLEVDGNRLLLQEGPKRIVGPGESVTIPHSTLKVSGYFTEGDKKYIEAAQSADIHNYMLSFVENQEDIEEMRRLDKDAEIIAKIESERGIQYVRENYDGTRLMAARGDMYMELQWPHTIPQVLEDILAKDKKAIVASRILDSLASCPEPSCSDVGDVDSMLRMGYKSFMFGDEVCLEKKSIMPALNILALMSERYESVK